MHRYLPWLVFSIVLGLVIGLALERWQAQQELESLAFDWIKAGNVSLLEQALNKGTNPNTCDEFGYPLIYFAAFSSDPALVKVLLKHGAAPNPNWTLEEHIAQSAAAGHAGCPPHGYDWAHGPIRTPLAVAVAYGNVESARTLIAAGANLHPRPDLNTSLLHLAAESGSLEMIDLMLAQGFDLEARDDNGFTSLGRACLKTDEQAILHLLTKGACTNVSGGTNGLSPLGSILWSGQARHNLPLITALLDAGADPNLEHRRRSLLEFLCDAHRPASDRGGLTAQIRLLVQYGAIVTPELVLVLQENDPELAEELAAHAE